MTETVSIILGGLLCLIGITMAATATYKKTRHAIIWRIILPVKRFLRYRPHRPERVYKISQ